MKPRCAVPPCVGTARNRAALFEEFGRYLKPGGTEGIDRYHRLSNAPGLDQERGQGARPGGAGSRNKGILTKWEREKNSRKSSVRAKVEHAFPIIKRNFVLASYRGVVKNSNRLFV